MKRWNIRWTNRSAYWQRLMIVEAVTKAVSGRVPWGLISFLRSAIMCKPGQNSNASLQLLPQAKTWVEFPQILSWPVRITTQNPNTRHLAACLALPPVPRSQESPIWAAGGAWRGCANLCCRIKRGMCASLVSSISVKFIFFYTMLLILLPYFVMLVFLLGFCKQAWSNS